MLFSLIGNTRKSIPELTENLHNINFPDKQYWSKGVNELEKQSSKSKKGDSSKQGSQAKRGMDSRRSNTQGSASQCSDETDVNNCKDCKD